MPWTLCTVMSFHPRMDAAGVVANHAAEACLIVGGGIGPKVRPCWAASAAQMVEYAAGLDAARRRSVITMARGRDLWKVDLRRRNCTARRPGSCRPPRGSSAHRNAGTAAVPR